MSSISARPAVFGVHIPPQAAAGDEGLDLGAIQTYGLDLGAIEGDN